MRPLSPWLLLVASFAVAASHAPACTIPVYRYALERWDLGSTTRSSSIVARVA
jgi:hypothetical protein